MNVRAAAGCLVVLAAGCERVIGADFGDVQRVECAHASAPARPAAQGGGGTDEVLVAITSVDVGDTDLADGTPGYRTIGLDLDGVCAYQGARPSCAPFAWAGPEKLVGQDGRDNAGGALMHAETRYFGIAPFTSQTITAGIQNGSLAPLALIRVRGYNLRVFDDDVELDWYVAEPPGTKPRLDETDVWPIWDQTLDGAPPSPGSPYASSKFRDGHAYVRDYKVVARLPPGTPLKLANVPFSVDDLTLVVDLFAGLPGAQPGGFSVAGGLLAGHVRATELFHQLPLMTQAFSLGLICKDDVSYPRIKTYFCAYIDSLADGRNEPDTDCDAISLGIEFKATKVKMGAGAPDTAFMRCPEGKDPVVDSCAIPAPQN